MKIFLIKIDFGYIGHDNQMLFLCEDYESANEKATEMAIDDYYSYNIDVDGVRTIEEIVEEDMVDIDDATEIHENEVIDNISVDIIEYDLNKHGHYSRYDCNFTEAEFKQHLRDNKIDEVLS